MNTVIDQKTILLNEIEKLHKRNGLYNTIGADYYEPGMMEYLEQSDGFYDENTGRFILQFEVKGTRYDGRTEQIEKVKCGDIIHIVREATNIYNTNNFTLFTEKDKNVGNMPAELCNAIAPIYDKGQLVLEYAEVSFVEPISKRSRYAKQAILFVELIGKIEI